MEPEDRNRVELGPAIQTLGAVREGDRGLRQGWLDKNGARRTAVPRWD